MGKNSFWFPHDTEIAGDLKIVSLIYDYGYFGYGIYWRIIEKLHIESLHKLPLEEYVFSEFAIQTQLANKQNSAKIKIEKISPSQIKKIIEDCIIKFKLFKSDKKMFWSERVIKNIDKLNKKSIINSENGRKGGLAKQAFAKRLLSEKVAFAKRTDSEGVAIKIKNKIENKKESKIKTLTNSKIPLKKKAAALEKNEKKINPDAAALIKINSTTTESELQGQVKKILEQKNNLPEIFISEQANLISKKYIARLPISDLKKLVDSWIEKLGDVVPKIILINGKKYYPKKNKNEWVYPDIRGKEFDKEKKRVLLIDETWQELSEAQINYVKNGGYKPDNFFKVQTK